jgi:hypothetical protein
MLKGYGIIWLVNILSAVLLYAFGMFTAWTGVIYGMVSFGLVFMGMMFLLPTVFIHHEPKAPKEESKKEKTIYLQNPRHA